MALPHPDAQHLRAAEGWLELGNPGEANQELDHIAVEWRAHPDVLTLRWQIQMRGKKWDACWVIARALTEDSPRDPRGWIALAQTLYYQKRYTEAYDLAISKITSFPEHWPLYYDAACYACLTGRLAQAKQFLQLAMTFGDAADVQRRAAQDPDFAALRQESTPS